MTTNVWDPHARIMACDSRWSVPLPFATIYADDTGFDKIEFAAGAAFMFAGDAKQIQAWKHWLALPVPREVPHPAVQGIALNVVCIADGTTLFEFGQDITLDGARFAGTGAFHACQCWISNRDSTRAVQTAMGFDLHSGGEVKYLLFSSGEHNLTNSATLSDLHNVLSTRGMVMYAGNGAVPQSLAEAAANDPRMKDVCERLMTGQLAASAPCDAMYKPWTEDDKRKLGATLEQLFGA